MNIAFVIGTGRSGLTPLMDLIAYHNDFAWPSQYNNKFPQKYYLSFLSRLVEIPLFNSTIKYKRFIPKHEEAYDFWNNSYRGFRRPFRDLTSNDVNYVVRNNFQEAVSNILFYQKKSYFIAEYSGWSRIDFMREIFPNAKFIHIVRDGRAVANSLTNVGYWMGWEGIYKWRWGLLDKELRDLWRKYDNSFLALAAIQWKILVNNIKENIELLPKENYLIIKYEDMVKFPIEIANNCLDFLGVDSQDKKFKKHLSTMKIIDANTKQLRIPPWKTSMTKKQIFMLNDILEEELKYYNY